MTNPLYTDLIRERYEPSNWFRTPPPEGVDTCNTKLMQGIRRRAISDVPEDHHENDEEVA